MSAGFADKPQVELQVDDGANLQAKNLLCTDEVVLTDEERQMLEHLAGVPFERMWLSRPEAAQTETAEMTD